MQQIKTRVWPTIPRKDRAAVAAHFTTPGLTTPAASIGHQVILPDGTDRWQQ